MAAKIRTSVIVHIATGERRRVPVDPHINNGRGASYYLGKRDPESGRRLYYTPEEYAAMSEADRKEAADFTPRDLPKASGDRLMANFHNADPLERKAFLDSLVPQLKSALGIGAGEDKGGDKKGAR